MSPGTAGHSHTKEGPEPPTPSLSSSSSLVRALLKRLTYLPRDAITDGWPNTESRLLFFNLNKLGRGDKVVLKDRRGRTYRYGVSETLVVDPNDRWVMVQVVGKHMLTL